MSFPWNDETVGVLTSLWDEGLSASEIMRRLLAQFSAPITRNAVIGKVKRLGLAPRLNPNLGDGLRKKRPKRNRVALAAAPRALTVKQPVAPDDPLREPLRREDGTLTTVATLNDHCCKWPFGHPGTPGFAFCSRPRMRGAYCEAHAAVAYLGPAKGAGHG